MAFNRRARAETSQRAAPTAPPRLGTRRKWPRCWLVRHAADSFRPAPSSAAASGRRDWCPCHWRYPVTARRSTGHRLHAGSASYGRAPRPDLQHVPGAESGVTFDPKRRCKAQLGLSVAPGKPPQHVAVPCLGLRGRGFRADRLALSVVTLCSQARVSARSRLLLWSAHPTALAKPPPSQGDQSHERNHRGQEQFHAET